MPMSYFYDSHYTGRVPLKNWSIDQPRLWIHVDEIAEVHPERLFVRRFGDPERMIDEWEAWIPIHIIWSTSLYDPVEPSGLFGRWITGTRGIFEIGDSGARYYNFSKGAGWWWPEDAEAAQKQRREKARKEREKRERAKAFGGKWSENGK